MTTPEYTKKAIAKYRNNFDIIQLRLPKGTKEKIKSGDLSIHDYIVKLVVDDIDKHK